MKCFFIFTLFFSFISLHLFLAAVKERCTNYCLANKEPIIVTNGRKLPEATKKDQNYNHQMGSVLPSGFSNMTSLTGNLSWFLTRTTSSEAEMYLRCSVAEVTVFPRVLDIILNPFLNYL